MRIVCDHPGTVAYITQYITHAVDLNAIEPDIAHLFGDTLDHKLFSAAFPGYFNQIPQKARHINLIILRAFLNSRKIH
jgi:hypothetical protein